MSAERCSRNAHRWPVPTPVKEANRCVDCGTSEDEADSKPTQWRVSTKKETAK